jgi:hypothetical protein
LAVLKINEHLTAEGTVLLTIEGRVIGPWVSELDRSCADALARRVGLTLDLSAVSFLDYRGLELLDRLGSVGVSLVNCPRFVTEQLRAWAESRR